MKNVLFMQLVLQFKGQSSWPGFWHLYIHPLFLWVTWPTPHIAQSCCGVCLRLYRLVRLWGMWGWWSGRKWWWGCTGYESWGVWPCEQLTWRLSEFLHLQFYGCQLLGVMNPTRQRKVHVATLANWTLIVNNIAVHVILFFDKRLQETIIARILNPGINDYIESYKRSSRVELVLLWLLCKRML